MNSESQLRTKLAIALALALVTLIIYWPVRQFAFVEYDDGDYVYKNVQVSKGLTVSGIVWAFTHSHSSNWHPLTWISHMVDCQFFGLNAGAHHLVNIVFHTLNTLLLFFWLSSVTGARWRSAIVAALFAWHPLHVESVAWVAERKDVLSAFFWLLTLWAYSRYARQRERRWYFTALALFALGLMAKPMVVTLPCVLLLLDFWPLQRWAWQRPAEASARLPGASKPASFLRLVQEKIPFFVLTGISCAITFWAQKTGGAVTPFDKLPIANRTANALVAYLGYLEKMLWPNDLAVIYPHPGIHPSGTVAVAVLVLLGITVLAVRYARRSPYLLVGWLWYLGTLVPVIGLVQVGKQALADRYTYLPLIGIFIGIVWGLAEWLARLPRRDLILTTAAGAALGGCLLATSLQVHVWRNSFSLFDHAQRVVPRNYIAHFHLGDSLLAQGRTEEAFSHYEKAVKLNPAYTDAMNNWGVGLIRKQRLQEAADLFGRAASINPEFIKAKLNLANALTLMGQTNQAVVYYEAVLSKKPAAAGNQNTTQPSELDHLEAHYHLANALVSQGRSASALEHYNQALQIRPDRADVRGGLAEALADGGRYEEAIVQFESFLQRQPTNASGHCAFAIALSKAGRTADATAHFKESIRLDPTQAKAHFNLGITLAAQRDQPGAISHFKQALALDPGMSDAHYHLGLALLNIRDGEAAVAAFREAIRLRPDWVQPLNALAWILATHQNPRLRNGAEALALAQRVQQQPGTPSPTFLNILAAAQAEAGKYDEAIATAEKAVAAASAANQTSQVSQFEARLKNYQQRKPFRDPALVSAGK